MGKNKKYLYIWKFYCNRNDLEMFISRKIKVPRKEKDFDSIISMSSIENETSDLYITLNPSRQYNKAFANKIHAVDFHKCEFYIVSDEFIKNPEDVLKKELIKSFINDLKADLDSFKSHKGDIEKNLEGKKNELDKLLAKNLNLEEILYRNFKSSLNRSIELETNNIKRLNNRIEMNSNIICKLEKLLKKI